MIRPFARLLASGCVAALALLCSCWRGRCPDRAEAQVPGVEHVVVIGVDGLSPEGVRRARTPVLHRMMAEGASTLHARGVMPTVSSPNWASMIMGAGPEQHGVLSNDWKPGLGPITPTAVGPGGIFPTVFGLLRQQRPSSQDRLLPRLGRLRPAGRARRLRPDRQSQGAGRDHRAGHRLPQGEAADPAVHPPRPRGPRRASARPRHPAVRLGGRGGRPPDRPGPGRPPRLGDGRSLARPGHVRPRRQGEGARGLDHGRDRDPVDHPGPRGRPRPRAPRDGQHL